jgi:hypothetical protein
MGVSWEIHGRVLSKWVHFASAARGESNFCQFCHVEEKIPTLRRYHVDQCFGTNPCQFLKQSFIDPPV